MTHANRNVAALALAFAFALSSCSSAGAQGASDSGAKILKRGPDGQATQVQVDGQVWGVCSKTITKHCIDPRPAGLTQ